MKSLARDFHRQWVAQCNAARTIRHRFGLVSALEYLVGEKLPHFVDLSERHPDFKRELPHFLAEIKRLFSLTELASFVAGLELRSSFSRPQRFAMRSLSSIFLGTRIRVVDVLELLAAGLSPAQVLRELPDLKPEDIKACLRYASQRLSHPVLAA